MARTRYIPLLDALRGIAALNVAIGHGLIPDNNTLGTQLERWAADGMRLVLNGQAAVFLFFVISGLCIHLPQRDRPFDWRTFLIRRFTRLLLPLAAASGIAYALDFRWFDFHNPSFLFGTTIVWSLFCEAAYYLAYGVVQSTPALRNRWWTITLASSPIAIVAAFLATDSLDVSPNGFVLATLIGWPVWLAGVLVAQHLRNHPPKRNRALDLFLWSNLLVGGAAATALKFFFSVPYAFTVVPWSILAAWWMHRHMHRHMHLDVPRWLALPGVASYSIYLVHQPVIHPLSDLLTRHTPGIASNPWALSITTTVLVFGLSALFYLIIEKPSHQLARALGKRPSI